MTDINTSWCYGHVGSETTTSDVNMLVRAVSYYV